MTANASTKATARTKLRKRLRKQGLSEEEIKKRVMALWVKQNGQPEPPPRVRTCTTVTGQRKEGWKTERAAKAALNRMEGLDRDGRSPAMLRPYHCPSCSLWHLGNARPSRKNRRP